MKGYGGQFTLLSKTKSVKTTDYTVSPIRHSAKVKLWTQQID